MFFGKGREVILDDTVGSLLVPSIMEGMKTDFKTIVGFRRDYRRAVRPFASGVRRKTPGFRDKGRPLDALCPVERSAGKYVSHDGFWLKRSLSVCFLLA
jgi:hypothetical protein